MKRIITFVFLCTLTFSLSSCLFMARCKNRQCGVRMEHYHNGDEFRGVSLFDYIFKYKNPRTGNGFPELVKDPAAQVKK